MLLRCFIAISVSFLCSHSHFCHSAETTISQRNMTIPLRQIHRFADGFNIEGNDLAKHLQPGQKWLNMCMPLYRPFVDKKTLAEISAENTFPLKEMSILDYDECKVNLVVMLIIDFFKKKGAEESLFIQVHRNSSGLTYINQLSDMLTTYYGDEVKKTTRHIDWPADPEKQGFPVFNFTNGFMLELRNGYKPNTIMAHPKFSSLFSLSLMGGLNHRFPSGTITFPTTFIPFDTQGKKIHLDCMNLTTNYLVRKIDCILDTNQERFFKVINQFKSKNDKKKHKATRITQNAEDFYPVIVLKINDLWDPAPDHFKDPVEILARRQSKL